jgi:regulatory associated protein of mTOR
MKNYHCTPHTYPRLPATNTHPLWASWDLAVDTCLRQMPTMMQEADPSEIQALPSAVRSRRTTPGSAPSPPSYTYVPSRFFTDQLTAFEVWISRGGSALTKRGAQSLPEQVEEDGPDGQKKAEVPKPPPLDREKDDQLVPRKPPEQLPIVLQVLLSQPHRLRALILLSQFVDLGPWAVKLALQIGIFPYISKLLQAAGHELRPVLIFIWARILAVDPTCQTDLLSNHGYKYFANVLGHQEVPAHILVPNRSEHKAMCAFVLAAIARDSVAGQHAVWRERAFDHCYNLLGDPDFLVRQWSALCIASMWAQNDEVRVYGVDTGAQDRLIAMLSDDSPEVRAAVLYALSTFLGTSTSLDPASTGGGGSGAMPHLDERVHFRMEVAVVTGAALAINLDASPLVKKELLVLVSCLVKEWRGHFVICAWIYWEEARRRDGEARSDEEDVSGQAVSEWLDGYGDDEAAKEENRVLLSSFFTIFATLLELSVDPYPEVATHGSTIVDYITALLIESPFSRLENSTLRTTRSIFNEMCSFPTAGMRSRRPSLEEKMPPPAPASIRPPTTRADTMTSSLTSGVSSTLRRTSSFANALKSLAGGIAFPSVDESRAASPVPSKASRAEREALATELARPPSPNLNIAQYTSPYSRPSTPQQQHGYFTRSPSPTTSTRGAPAAITAAAPAALPETPAAAGSMDFLPSDVMEALMEEDMERLRARRRVASQGRGRGYHGSNGTLPSPSGSTFSTDSNGSVITGLGTGVGIRDALPLKSKFFDWCMEYFKEPQMRVSFLAFKLNTYFNGCVAS